jgi:ribonuclease HII
VPAVFATQVLDHLIREGALEAAVPLGGPEVWRVKLADATFTLYKNGTLYSTGTPSKGAAVEEALAFIDAVLPKRFEPSEKAFWIGLDESGKGELVGHLTLACALVPATLAPDLQRLVELAETKRKRSDGYFDRLFVQLDALRPRGVDFGIEKVTPREIDRYNLNRLLDVNYRRLLNSVLDSTDPEGCRIVVDNYGVGPNLNGFLRALERRGAEVVVEAGADDRYLEARVASVLARREREKELQAINSNEEFLVDGLSVGAGSSSSEQTLAWLGAWKKTGKEWPGFIRRSYRPVCGLDGTSPPKKRDPPLRNEPVDGCRDDGTGRTS